MEHKLEYEHKRAVIRETERLIAQRIAMILRNLMVHEGGLDLGNGLHVAEVNYVTERDTFFVITLNNVGSNGQRFRVTVSEEEG